MELYLMMIVSIIYTIACIWCYRQGIKDGRSIKEDKPIEDVIKPKKVAKSSDKDIADGFANIMNYNADKEYKEGVK